MPVRSVRLGRSALSKRASSIDSVFEITVTKQNAIAAVFFLSFLFFFFFGVFCKNFCAVLCRPVWIFLSHWSASKSKLTTQIWFSERRVQSTPSPKRSDQMPLKDAKCFLLFIFLKWSNHARWIFCSVHQIKIEEVGRHFLTQTTKLDTVCILTLRQFRDLARHLESKVKITHAVSKHKIRATIV